MCVQEVFETCAQFLSENGITSIVAEKLNAYDALDEKVGRLETHNHVLIAALRCVFECNNLVDVRGFALGALSIVKNKTKKAGQ